MFYILKYNYKDIFFITNFFNKNIYTKYAVIYTKYATRKSNYKIVHRLLFSKDSNFFRTTWVLQFPKRCLGSAAPCNGARALSQQPKKNWLASLDVPRAGERAARRSRFLLQ